MKIVQHGKKRKAISPVLATVILIAITLIAAIAVAGFVFGLFGSFTSTAQVSASIASCSAPLTDEVCVLNFINTGTANTGGSTVCAVTWSGVQHTGILSGAATGAGSIPADNANHQATCTIAGVTAAAGLQVVGTAQLLNGGVAQFSGQTS